MLILVFWVVTKCGLVGRYQRSSTLKMDAVCAFETLVCAVKSAGRYKFEDEHPQIVAYIITASGLSLNRTITLVFVSL
jgi:hypothetical protein